MMKLSDWYQAQGLVERRAKIAQQIRACEGKGLGINISGSLQPELVDDARPGVLAGLQRTLAQVEEQLLELGIEVDV